MRDLLFCVSVFKPQKRVLCLGLFLMLLTLLSGAGLLIFSSWFLTACTLAHFTVAGAKAFNFLTPGAVVRELAIVRIASRYFERLVTHQATLALLSFLRCRWFDCLVHLHHQHRVTYRKSDLLERLVTDIDGFNQLYLRLFLPFFSAILVTGMLSLVMFWINVSAGLLTIGLSVGWLVIMPPIFYRLALKSSVQQALDHKDMRAQILDYLNGMRNLHICSTVWWLRDRLEKTNESMQVNQLDHGSFEGIGEALLTIWLGTGSLVMLALLSEDTVHGVLSAPFMVMALFGVYSLFEVMNPISKACLLFGKYRFSIKRLRSIVEAPQQPFGTINTVMNPEIQFEQMMFHYSSHNHTQPLLNDISMTIQPGEHVALIGRSGAGKTTLLQLLTRRVDPSQGQILLGGRSLSEYSESALCSAFTVVSQQTDILRGSVRENLTIAAPSCSDTHLEIAMKETGLIRSTQYQTVSSFLDTQIGQGGITLSGGERRRLAMARAWLKGGDILLLDEPTEGLDPQAEIEVLNALLDRFKDKTIVLISHRRSVLTRMDRILHLNDGRISINKNTDA